MAAAAAVLLILLLVIMVVREEEVQGRHRAVLVVLARKAVMVVRVHQGTPAAVAVAVILPSAEMVLRRGVREVRGLQVQSPGLL